jgi:hypothetical protein
MDRRRVWNWSDCHKQVPESLCLALLARVYRKPLWQRLVMREGIQSLRMIALHDPAVPAAVREKPALSKFFPGVGAAVMRTGFGPKDEFVGFKAGVSGTARNHSHLDLGSLVIFANGRELLAEPEFWPYAGDWTPGSRTGGFFDSAPEGRRWNFDCNAGISHNIPVIGTECPRPERRSVARIFLRESGRNFDLMAADITSGYKPLAKRVRRYLAYLRPGIVILVDELRLRQKRKAQILYHFEGRAKPGHDCFTVRNGRAELSAQSLCPSREHNLVLGKSERISTYHTEHNLEHAGHRYIYIENFHCESRLVFVAALAFGPRPLTLPRFELSGDPAGQDRFKVIVTRRGKRMELRFDLGKGKIFT